MEIQSFSFGENPYRDEVIDLIIENNEATNPSIQEMVNKWMAEQRLGLEDAAEKFYQENTDEAIIATEKEEVVAFLLLKKNDEDLREKVPDYWPNTVLELLIVREENRRQGIAQKITNYTEKHVLPEYPENILWITSTNNTASQKFAESNDFQKLKELEEERKTDVKTLIYGKKSGQK
jgi:ribosomal protein S18 acetylase RimI-like enzyme